MKRIVYADNAATTSLSPAAFNAMIPWLKEEYGNASQPYSFARKPKKALQDARELIANCVGAESEEIIFTSGGTESDNWAIKSVLLSNKERPHIITSAVEHHAVLNSCEYLKKLGIPISYLLPDENGLIHVESLKEAIGPHTTLVSIMLSNNEIGTIEPIKELCQVAHEKGSLFHSDAVQTIGHVQVDVKDLDVDMLSASAHKFNGPKGIGFLYKKKSIQFLPFLNGGMQEQGLRAGTENIAAVVGMAVALEENCKDLKRNQEHISQLENALLSQLLQEKVVFVRNGAEKHVPGNVSLSFKGCNGEMLLHRLDLMGICVSTGSACNSNKTEISHVLKAIHLDEESAVGTIRVSLGKDNSLDDVNYIVKSLVKILRSLN